jgi:hypothetical protein
MIELFDALYHWSVTQPTYLRAAIWILVCLLVLFILYLLFMIVFFPGMYLYNKMTDRNKSNVMAEDDYLIGELTTRIRGHGMGEVIDTSSGMGFSVHSARLYREEDRESGLTLPVGTEVLIIDFDADGVALVVENKK